MKGGGSSDRTARPLRLSKKAAGCKSNINSEKELQGAAFFSLFIQNTVGPGGANAFAFCVVRLLPYPYTPTEAHSLPLQPFRQPPSVSKTELFDTLTPPPYKGRRGKRSARQKISRGGAADAAGGCRHGAYHGADGRHRSPPASGPRPQSAHRGGTG